MTTTPDATDLPGSLPKLPGTMTDRQRFLATMRYQPRDRTPICDFGFWPETIETWYDQRLPREVTWGRGRPENTTAYFGMDRFAGGPGANAGLCPGFEHKVLEDRGDQEVVQDVQGVRVLRHKRMSSIPMHLGHLLTDRASWEQHFKPRLDPDTPARYPDWDRAEQAWADDNHPTPRTIDGGSLFGKIRDWMGLEAVSYLVYDDPGLFEEMVETLTTCILEVHRRCFEHGARFDACAMWEDMCFASGPLLPPDLFERYLVPRYRRITDQLRAHGCAFTWVDCDGKIDALVPLWLDAGVNVMFPLEVGTWGGDPVAFRRVYGKDLRLMGGFDKRTLARTPRAITAEVHRLAPLVAEGGYIPFCDHRVPPDVPLANYRHYLAEARRVWAGE